MTANAWAIKLLEKFFTQLIAVVLVETGGKTILSEMNAKDLQMKVSPDTTAILIFGACENHGDHLPFGSDFIMPYELAKMVASKSRNVLIFPPVPYGVSSHHKDFAMTVSLEPETMINVVRNILQSLVDNKVSRILIINGHDGNIAPIELKQAPMAHPVFLRVRMK